MAREIKFRAWDIELKQYVYRFNYNDYEISDEDGSIYITKNIETSGETPVLELEQFTGLHDKNGEEIYEGDVLKDKYGNIGDAHWYGSGFEFINTSGMMEDGIEWEIVGNIHEYK